MKKDYIKKVSTFLAIIIILIVPVLTYAQPIDPTPGNPDAPVDGGLSLLIAGGIGYGVKKVREQRRKQNEK